MKTYSEIAKEFDLLPESLEFWPHRIDRHHSPRQGRYSTYRPCLRREFQFQCAFCCTHEADLTPRAGSTTERTGLFAIEHFHTRSAHPEKRDEYENCFYICRYCNSARGALSVESAGSKLLNPCVVVWSDHFYIEEYMVQVHENDQDAGYTQDCYDLNDPFKAEVREERESLMRDSKEFMRKADSLIEKFLRYYKDTKDEESRDMALQLERLAVKALRDLVRFRKVPVDVPEKCRCS